VMLPALTLAWVVLIGWFTGERVIAFARRIVTRLARARRRLQSARAVTRPQLVLRRGGLLLADSLASRPPPNFAPR
jgi:xanthosine utilization system XapX-like protein